MRKVTVCLTEKQMNAVIDAFLEYMQNVDRAAKVLAADGDTRRAAKAYYDSLQETYHELVNAPEVDE